MDTGRSYFRVFNIRCHQNPPLLDQSSVLQNQYLLSGGNQFPWVEPKLVDNPGGDYDLEGEEGSQNPLIEVSVYYDSASGDSKCYEVSAKARGLMTAYGFQCRSGPGKTESQNADTIRWVSRYQRIFGSGDSLEQLE